MPSDQYLPFLKEVLTPRRLEHSISVMQVMGDLSTIYGFDRELGETIGILHDAGKDLDLEHIQRLIDQADIQIHYECDWNYLLHLHGPVGAAYVRNDLGLTDPLVLAAIESHTSYGNSPYFDCPVCWCLRFADVLEPTRNFQDEPLIQDKIHQLKALVYSGKMAEAVVYQTGMLMGWFEEKGFPVHPNMRKSHREFSARINPDVQC